MATSKIPVILRCFKAGWGKRGKKIPQEELDAYRKHVRDDINRYRAMDSIGTIYIVTNGDLRSPHREHLKNGMTPTARFIREEFPNDKSIKILVCKNWGKNSGSATALNLAIKRILKGKTPKYVLIASTTVDLSERHIIRAMDTADAYHLQACGVLRENYWDRYQWQLVQNTAVIWRLSVFKKYGLFSESCNGDGRTVLAGGREAALAGMEDFHFMLRIFKKNPADFRWGMIGRKDSVYWSVAHYNAEESERHMIKILRQEAVIKQYVRDAFPDESFNQVMNNFFACGLELP